MRKRSSIILMLALLAVSASLLLPATASAATLGVPLTGTFSNTAGTGHFVGTFNIQNFASYNGKLVAVGSVVGNLVDATGKVLGTVAQGNVALPVATPAGASCSILHLTLGPLDLNLLGLVVHLNQVVLDITAQSGPGNLLGNLLCQIANLLNGSPSLGFLVNLLNKLLLLLG
jgi:hypothetical protein